MPLAFEHSTMLDLILVNLVTILHSICVYFINSYFFNKPLGSQTLYHLVLANTLIVQVVLGWTTVLTSNMAAFMEPVCPFTAWLVCAIIDFIIFHHNLFIILTVSVRQEKENQLKSSCLDISISEILYFRYFSIFHPSLVALLHDQQFLQTSWKVISSLAFVLTFYDLALVPYNEMSIYSILVENFEAEQIGSKLNSFLFLTWVCLYIILQILIENQDIFHRDYNNDRWSCILAVSFFCICWIVIFGFKPTVKVMNWRILAQISWTLAFLLRFMLQNHSLLLHIKMKFGYTPMYLVCV